MVEVPEIAPDRLDGDDTDGIRRSLEEHGFACVRCARLPTPPPTHAPPTLKPTVAPTSLWKDIGVARYELLEGAPLKNLLCFS